MLCHQRLRQWLPIKQPEQIHFELLRSQELLPGPVAILIILRMIGQAYCQGIHPLRPEFKKCQRMHYIVTRKHQDFKEPGLNEAAGRGQEPRADRMAVHLNLT